MYLYHDHIPSGQENEQYTVIRQKWQVYYQYINGILFYELFFVVLRLGLADEIEISEICEFINGIFKVYCFKKSSLSGGGCDWLPKMSGFGIL